MAKGVLIIGAGLSGLMTAVAAARAGLDVKVIAKGLGALHWGAGTIDVLGYLPGDEEQAVKRPFDALPALAARKPNHPYAIVGRDAVQEALADFRALTQEIGAPYGGAADVGDNLLLPSPAGGLRPALLAPQAQLGGDLSRPEPMLIVGFRGLRDFYPELIADNLNKQGFTARAIFLPGELLTDRRDANTVHLANGLDDRNRRARLANALQDKVRPGERVGFPAILGMDDHATALADFERMLRTAVFEIPTLPPSVPGIRLFKALRRYLLQQGVRVEAGMEVIATKTAAAADDAGDVLWVASETSARPLKHRAQAFVLATGGVLGGGFDSNIEGQVREKIFDLPLTSPQQRHEWFRASFLHPEGHPVFNGGVAVNEAFQPVDGDGRLLYRNLWTVGNALTDCDTILERSLEGVGIVTGVAAAAAIAAKLAVRAA